MAAVEKPQSRASTLAALVLSNQARRVVIGVEASSVAAMHLLQRLGKNLGGYYGERIRAEEVLAEVAAAAANRGWRVRTIAAGSAGNLTVLEREPAIVKRRVYLSAGIHGDEPAGPLAVRQLIEEDRWPVDAHLVVWPMLNPRGLARGTRENARGVDLNRDYREPKTDEVKAHLAWLKTQARFDVALCLHEDWEASGFYVYERTQRAEAALARRIVAEVGKSFPVDRAETIDGWRARDGVILANDPVEMRPLWAEALYLGTFCANECCTLEAPSDFPLPARVGALVAGVRAALD